MSFTSVDASTNRSCLTIYIDTPHGIVRLTSKDVSIAWGISIPKGIVRFISVDASIALAN